MTFSSLSVPDFEWNDQYTDQCLSGRLLSPLCWLVLLSPLIMSLTMAAIEMTGFALASADMTEVYGVFSVVTRGLRGGLQGGMARIQALWEADKVAMIGSVMAVCWVSRVIALQ